MMWLAVLAAGLASYLMRVLPLFALGRLELPERLSTALQHAATGAMAVMLVTAAAHAAGVGGSAATGVGAGDSVPAVGRALGVVLAVGVGLLLGRRGRSMPVVVVTSLLAYVGVTAASFVVVALLR
jgi:hypothetical protein